MKMKVYILGKMRGVYRYNFPAFDAMAEKLLRGGFAFINPAELDRQSGFDVASLPATHDWSRIDNLGDNHKMTLDAIVSRDLDALKECNAYVALDGWEESSGARAEKGVLDWKKAVRLDPETLEPYIPNVPPPGINSNVPPPGTNPKDLYGMKKPPLRLIPPVAMLYLSRAMALGAKKYGEWNWRKDKVRTTVYIEAAMRHLSALSDGEDFDRESGLPHEAHAMACMAILLDARAVNMEVDDRNKGGAVGDLIVKLTE